MKTSSESTSSQSIEILISGSGERLVLPDAPAMFQGIYNRQASDLVIEGPDGALFRIVDYYNADATSDLHSEFGAVLTADVVERLVGAQNPMVFAQSGLPSGQDPIGQVETLEGAAFATRANGQRVALNVGDPVFEDDLVETANDSTLGLTFIDETVFSLSANARMILDELVYEPNGSDNSMVMNLVQGTFVFITGQVAPTGDMLIETPVATMGIRGTTPIVMIDGQNGDTEFGILKDPDGNIGEYAIYDKITKQIIGRVIDEGTILQLDQVGGALNTISVDPARLTERAEAQSNAYFLHTVARDRINSQQQYDNQSEDGNGSNGNGSADPITTEPSGDQTSLGSSGLSQFSFNTGNDDSGDATGSTTSGSNSNSTGSSQQQSAGSTQIPGTFTPTNTPPTTSDQTFQLSEDVEIAQASLPVTDGAGSLIYTITRQPEFGAVVVNADGTFTYIADPIFNVLQQGESAAISFDFQATDSAGAVSNLSTVTLQILGVNDAPIATTISADATNEDAGAVSINLLSTSLDPDTGDDADTLNVAVTSSNIARNIVFSIDNETGAFSFDPSQFEDLSLNESEVLTINYTIVDTLGGSTTNSATVTIEGRDDAAVIAGATNASIVEDAVADTVTGDLNATDVDDLDDSWIAVGAPIASNNGFGAYTIDGTGNWIYTLDNGNPMVNALNVGDMLTDTFTVQTVDGTTQTVTITIDGADDAAVITGTVSGTVVEDAVASTVAGDLDAIDVDDPDDSWTGFDTATASINGFGTYTIDATGKWIYTLDNGNPTVDALNVGFTLTDMFTVQTAGGTNQTVVITIDGTNDAAVITGATYGAVVEDAVAQTVTGALNATDVDDPDDTWIAVGAPIASNSGFGSFTIDGAGTWIYTLDSGNSTVNALNVGDKLTDTFTAQTVDGTAQTVTITIYGAPDAAVITGTVSGTIVEDAVTNIVTGDLNVTGLAGPDDSWTVVGMATASESGFGTFTFDAAGVWAFTLNNSNAIVDALNVGDALTDTFTVTTAEGDPQIVSITINGAYDYYYSYSYLRSASGEDSNNGDRFEDIVVRDPKRGSEGNAYVVFGAERVALDGHDQALMNLDGGVGDGFADLIVDDPTDATDGNSYIVYGGTQFAIGVLDSAAHADGEVFSVESIFAGDVNGDGISDLIIGDAEAGEDIYVVFGLADGEVPASNGATGDMDLSLTELGPVVDAAIDRWGQAGLSSEQIEFLKSITFEIADLHGDQVGMARGEHIILDDDAAGHGWFIDSTPFDDSEFTYFLSETYLQAEPGHGSNNGIDLLTTVLHEFGHELGLEHVDEAGSVGDLLFEELVAGERRLPGDSHAEAATLGNHGPDKREAPIAGDDGQAGEFGVLPGGTFDLLINGLFANDFDPHDERFDLTGIFSERGGIATLEQVDGEAVVRFVADASAENGQFGGFQYEITNTSGGVGFATVDIMIDDLVQSG